MNKIDKQLQSRIDDAKSQRKFIRTPRLFLMPLAVSDAPQVFKWTGDAEVTRFMSYATYQHIKQVEEWLERVEKDNSIFGFFLHDGQLIGSGGVGRSDNGKYSLGYNLAKEHWGKGYCTEASKAMLAYTAEVFGVADFVCNHATENVRSQRVIEKCGFTFEKYGSYQKQDGSQTFESREYSLHVDLHQMNLDDGPFEKIANGSKTIEMRLNDERRQGLKEGDFVTFTNNVSGEKIVAKAVTLHKFADFEELYKTLDLLKCGYTKEQLPTASPRDMLRYYSAERQAQYGALGIEIQLLCIL